MSAVVHDPSGEAEEAGADGLSCGELFGWVCSSEEADPSVDVVG